MGFFKTLRDLFTYDKKQRGPAGEYDDFLNKGYWMPVVSSNVDLAQYDYMAEELFIQYKNGAVYKYSNVTYREALSFTQAGSHGKWVWDHLRIRGTKFGHKKPYSLDRFT